MRYYPLNRVKTNLRTAGEDFLLNGQPYRGPYYQTYDGESFTGASPAQGPSQRLTPAQTVEDVEPVRGSTGTIITQIPGAPPIQELGTFLTPQPYYPTPTEDDYARRSFMRYFAKKRGISGFVIEINKDTYDSLKQVDSVYDYVTYETISTFWQLTGPLRDDRTNKQYKIAGIIDTNERLINAKEPSFPGLKAFIGGDYAKFANITDYKVVSLR